MIKSFPVEILEAIAKLFADTKGGFTGDELGRLLALSDIADPGEMTKWRRLLQAFQQQQRLDNCGNKIGSFIQNAMAPGRYLQNHALFDERRGELNKMLSLCGIAINEKGTLIPTERTETVREALRRSECLRSKLRDCGTHPEVFKYCSEELVAENYFHAVFEATKGIVDRLRLKTGLTGDGAEIVDRAFASENPMVAINTLQSKSEQAEHKGFANLLKGAFGFIRNPLAHEAKLNWQMDEQDALDSFALISLIHRRIDNMVLIPRGTSGNV